MRRHTWKRGVTTKLAGDAPDYAEPRIDITWDNDGLGPSASTFQVKVGGERLIFDLTVSELYNLSEAIRAAAQEASLDLAKREWHEDNTPDKLRTERAS
jgi:hypothetical protein